MKIKNGEIPIEEREPFKKLREAMVNSLKDYSVFMKLNYFIGVVVTISDKENINWEKINKVLKDFIDEYDYNTFLFSSKEINSIERLAEIRDDLNISSIGNLGAWRKGICKKCGDEFSLSYDEVMFYKNKKLHLPKRCYFCRKGIPKPKDEQPKINISQETVECKTDLEIALEKAGLLN